MRREDAIAAWEGFLSKRRRSGPGRGRPATASGGSSARCDCGERRVRRCRIFVPLTSPSSHERAVAMPRVRRLRSSASILRLGSLGESGSRRARRTRETGLIQGIDRFHSHGVIGLGAIFDLEPVGPDDDANEMDVNAGTELARRRRSSRSAPAKARVPCAGRRQVRRDLDRTAAIPAPVSGVRAPASQSLRAARR